MTRRQRTWTVVCLVVAAGLGLVLVTPTADARATAAATATSTTGGPSAVAPLLVAPAGSRPSTSDGYSGYYENLLGPLSLSATFTVPVAKCTNSATWATQVRLLAVLDSETAAENVGEHGGGVEVGCSKTGAPTYAAALCDPSQSGDASYSGGCASPDEPVAAGDQITVTVTATGGCNPTCASVDSTVTDASENWEASAASASNSDFDTFVAVVGVPPLVDFGKSTVNNLSVGGLVAFGGQRANFVDLAGHTLARASALTRGRTSFTLKWVRAS